jgi:hypothetical protein
MGAAALDELAISPFGVSTTLEEWLKSGGDYAGSDVNDVEPWLMSRYL